MKYNNVYSISECLVCNQEQPVILFNCEQCQADNYHWIGSDYNINCTGCNLENDLDNFNVSFDDIVCENCEEEYVSEYKSKNQATRYICFNCGETYDYIQEVLDKIRLL